MVFYHGFYTMAYLLNLPLGEALLRFFMPAEPWFAGLFILIAGISSDLSHSNLVRGAKLFGVALLVTLATAVAAPQELIVFGILHFLSSCSRAYRTLLRGCGHCGRPMPNGPAWGLRALPGATNLSSRWNLQSMRREKSGAATAFARRDVCGWGSICSLSCCRRRWARS